MEFIKPDWKVEAERRGESLPGYWTLKEAAQFLGYADVSYLSYLARNNKIPTYKIGSARFLVPEQLSILMEKKEKN